MVSFTDNPLNNPTAAADLLRVFSITATDSPSARDSAQQHTTMLSAAHTLSANGSVNPLLISRSMRTAASARLAVKEANGSEGATVDHFGEEEASPVSYGLYEGGPDEAMALRLKRFATPVAKEFTNKVHFFQALEQGAIDRHLTSVEDADMAMIAQMGAFEGVEGEEVAAATVSGLPRGSVNALARVYESTDRVEH